MNVTQLMNYFDGDYTKAAAFCEVTENSVRNWSRAGSIPIVQQRSIEVLTKGKLKADKL